MFLSVSGERNVSEGFYKQETFFWYSKEIPPKKAVAWHGMSGKFQKVCLASSS